MSIVLSRTQNIRPQSNLDKYEHRSSRYGALSFVVKDTNAIGGIAKPGVKSAFLTGIGSTVETAVIKNNPSVSIGSTRSISVSAAENTTAMVSISRTTITFGFRMFPTLFKNNEIGYQEDFEAKWWDCWNTVYASLDSLAAAYLDTNKTTVFNDYLDPTYSLSSDVVVAPLANEMRLLGDVDVMMDANDFFRTRSLIGNGGLQSMAGRLKQSALYNAENKALQLMDKELFFSTRITNDAGHLASFYAVENGSTAFLTGVDREALARTRSADKGREWDMITDPLFGFAVGSMYYEEDGDYNAIAGAASADMTASHAECFGFSFDYGFVNPYNSDAATRPNPIAKFAVATT